MRKLKPLSPKQAKRVNRLVKKECCNFDNGNCILLDDEEACPCPQLISCSLLCRWFSDAVLPLDRELFTELYAKRRNKLFLCMAILRSSFRYQKNVFMADSN